MYQEKTSVYLVLSRIAILNISVHSYFPLFSHFVKKTVFNYYNLGQLSY